MRPEFGTKKNQHEQNESINMALVPYFKAPNNRNLYTMYHILMIQKKGYKNVSKQKYYYLVILD